MSLNLAPVSVVGDGLAGLLVATTLMATGRRVTVHGDGQSNTPPLALVHLFAGRSFRRSALEIEVFRRAVDYWRTEPLAREWPVHRRVEPGDRLDRSSRDHQVPNPFAPRPLSDFQEGQWFQYGPGFSVKAQELAAKLRDGLTVRTGRVELEELPQIRILALGVKAADHLSGLAWDRSAGRTVTALPEKGAPSGITIGGGLHILPAAGQNVVLGGRFSATAGACEDELEKARELTGVSHQELSVWTGERLTPALDRRPLLGWMDERTFLFVGFGSRGLFWLPYCVDLTIRALGDRHLAIPAELDWRRTGRDCARLAGASE